MTAYEIAQKNYNRFEDKKDITSLINALYCTESGYTKRDEEGDKMNNVFEEGVFEAIKDVMKNEFVASKWISAEVKDLCVEIIKGMQY